MKAKQGVPPLLIFLAMGLAGRRTFLAVGIVFLSIGAVLLVRQQRADGSK